MIEQQGAAGLAASETIRRQIRRYYLFLVLNRDSTSRKVLRDLIKGAEAQLAALQSSQPVERILSDLRNRNFSVAARNPTALHGAIQTVVAGRPSAENRLMQRSSPFATSKHT